MFSLFSFSNTWAWKFKLDCVSNFCRTYVFKKENHTLGNALRSMLLTNPQVKNNQGFKACLILKKTGVVCGLHHSPPCRGSNAPQDPNSPGLPCSKCSEVSLNYENLKSDDCANSRKALVDLRALTVLTKSKFEEAEAKFVAENPGN